MRICLIARNSFHRDRRARVIYNVLTDAGHEVDVVATTGDPPTSPVTVTVPRQQRPAGRFAAIFRRLRGQGNANRHLHDRLANAAADTGSNVYVPLHEDTVAAAVAAARISGGVVQRQPGDEVPNDVDLTALAPAHPDLAPPTFGIGDFHTPADVRPGWSPTPGRHAGISAVLCYRKTESNPGRYMEDALRRSGIQLRVETDHIDLSSVESGASFILFVESPYPAIEVRGSTSVPTFFWAHHGEHHLYANVRLTRRYRADAVLLAHSWHLAHWFPARVHRFPFAIDTEFFDASKRLVERKYDVAMVGSKLRGDAWQYRDRQRLISEIESAVPRLTTAFVEGVPPRQMAEIYAEARIVLNEGGIRHNPITMRIFEGIGSGAAVVTDRAPGLEMLMRPGVDFSDLSEDPIGDVTGLLERIEETQERVDGALEHACRHHTYDHRVDELVQLAASTPKRTDYRDRAGTPLGRLIDRDVEVQRIIHHDSMELVEELTDREVWSLEERRDGRLKPTSMDAAVITADSVSGLEPMLDTARLRIYAASGSRGLDEYVSNRAPEADWTNEGELTRVDLMADSYRVVPSEDRRARQD